MAALGMPAARPKTPQVRAYMAAFRCSGFAATQGTARSIDAEEAWSRGERSRTEAARPRPERGDKVAGGEAPEVGDFVA